MNLHLPSCYFCISMGWALHTAPAQISTPWPLHLLEAIAASTFATPQLNFTSRPYPPQLRHCYQLWGLAFRASLRALGFTWGQEQPGDRLWSSMLPPPPPEGHLAWRDCSQSKLQQCQKVPSLFSSFFFFLSSPHCGSFFHQIIPGNSYFCKNSDIILIRW